MNVEGKTQNPESSSINFYHSFLAVKSRKILLDFIPINFCSKILNVECEKMEMYMIGMG